MRLYGHIGYKDSLPGKALCGKPKRAERGPALVFCGKCVAVVIAESRQTSPQYTLQFRTTGHLTELTNALRDAQAKRGGAA